MYATSANTESVRLGYEMGGYLKEECESCKRKAEQPEKVKGMRKVAHYFYPGAEIVIEVGLRRIKIRHPDGSCPFDPCWNKPQAHPAENDVDPGIPTYEEIGLYYNYEMPGTGWDGDC
ncbi:hypothetical protein [Ectopseudomonas mendocina]|uniref:hypothetical protein n=1 Tax=Ectopseudomonas mendocina TaxID=300 RepID=UPI0011C07E57|nr:hypothetical protein [Pseudomonas mendocina]